MYPYRIENFDYYIMLLSTDWCLHDLSIRLEVNFETMQRIQRSAQAATKHIASTIVGPVVDYNLVDLSNARKKETWGIFLQNLGDKELISKVADFITGLTTRSHEEGVTLNVFYMLLEDWCRPQSDDIDLSELSIKKSRLCEIFNDSISGSNDSDNQALNSDSKWDRYLLELFPEVPTALADFYDLHIANMISFDRVWSEFLRKLSEDDRSKLVRALVKAYEHITGNTCIVPTWMLN